MYIRKVILFKCQGMHDIHHRPYITSVSQESLDYLKMGIDRSNGLVNTPVINEVASKILVPSAVSQGIAPIINGWKEERYRFILETEIRDTLTDQTHYSFYIGHTDRAYEAYVKLYQDAHIDPNLRFTINSAHHFKMVNRIVNGEMRTMIMPANDHAQFVYSNGASIEDAMNHRNMTYLIQPDAVFKRNSNLSYLDELGVIPSSTLDVTGSLVSSGEKLNRRNNVASTYLYDMLAAQQRAQRDAVSTGHIETTYTAASNYLRNPQIFHDPMMTELSSLSTMIRQYGTFEWGTLLRLFPDLEQRTTIINNTDSQVNHLDMSHWAGSDMNTVAASVLVNAVPTIMLETLIGSIRIQFTNKTRDNRMSYQVLDAPYGVSDLAIPDINAFADRVIIECLNGITLSDSYELDLYIDASVFGETYVNISVAGLPPTPYVMPTFADNVASPAITHDVTHHQTVINDLTVLMQEVGPTLTTNL